jgi:hypothetical protein
MPDLTPPPSPDDDLTTLRESMALVVTIISVLILAGLLVSVLL